MTAIVAALAGTSRRRLAAAAVAGLLAVAGFAPFGWTPLPLLALAVFALAWQRAASPAEAGRNGYGFGLAFFCAGVSWVYVSLHDFGMMPLPLAVLATFLFCAFLALFPAVVAYAVARLNRGPAVSLLLLFPALWTLSEWVRGWVFTGFPWLAMGYSQTDSPLVNYAPLGGVFAVSLAAALAGGLLALVAISDGGRRWAALAGLGALVLMGWLLRYPEWTTPEGRAVDVALAQGNIAQSMKFDPDIYEATLRTYQSLAAAPGARLVVLPETAIPRFLDSVDPAYLGAMQARARAAGADVLLGAPFHVPQGGYYNAVVSLGVSVPQVYRKSHLVPFGEFVPPAFGWILDIMKIPMSDFNRGPGDQQPMQLQGNLRVAVNICYEDAFGEEIIRMLPQANLLVNASNVAWFGNSLAPEQHLQISRLRAIETGRYMLRATNTGVTAIIDQRGRVVSRLPQFQAGLVRGLAQPYAGATPFVRVGNWLVIGLCLAMLIAGIARTRRGESQ